MSATGASGSESAAGGQAWAIACRDENLRQIGEADTWSAMRAIGVDGVEVQVNRDGTCPHLFVGGRGFSIATPREAQSLIDEVCSRGGTVTALCLMNEFDEHPVDEEVAFVGRAVDVAVALGVPVIRLDFLPRRMKEHYDEYVALSIEVGRRIIEATAGTPIRFGVENHVTTTNRIEFLRALFDGVGSERMGLTLDTANFYWFGHPLSKLYDIYQEFAPRTCHTHCKSIGYPEAEREKQRPMGWEYGRYACPIDKGDIDLRRVIAILREAGYQGDLCIENESLGRATPEERREVLAAEAAYLRGLLME